MAEGVPPIGMTRVGLHVGDAIVGNFGGEGRIQYTALGDSMNTASRLESANKSLKTGVLISAEAAATAGRDDLMPMGRVTLRGRARPADDFTLRPDLSAAQRARIAEDRKGVGSGKSVSVRVDFGGRRNIKKKQKKKK